MKRIQLSDHFKLSTILLFSLPSIGMQIVDNTYQVADGYFISNYISEAAFEAENLIFPPLLIVMYVLICCLPVPNGIIKIRRK